MARSDSLLIPEQKENGWSISSSFISSIVFHLVVFVGIPLFLKFAWKPRTFQRPQTFQLVSPLRPVNPQKVTNANKQRVARKEVKPEPKPAPSTNKTENKDVKPQPKKEPAQSVEENVDELESILEELPAPARVSAVGDFKFHWYLNNVQQKLERYWNPPTENRQIKVVVHFIIFNDGNISEPSISRSSGSSTIDNIALRAVKLAAPFGRLPPGFSGDKLDLNCTLIPTRK
ncbi:MAG TPA: TonB family protein [Chitinispirillaceae bacterium]|nr:TonB family protein [Chitinispirillaceae bacterium]